MGLRLLDSPGHHPLFEQIDYSDRLVAVRTRASQANLAHDGSTLLAALGTEDRFLHPSHS